MTNEITRPGRDKFAARRAGRPISLSSAVEPWRCECLKTRVTYVIGMSLSFGEILNELRFDLDKLYPRERTFRSRRSRGSLVFKELAHSRTGAGDGPE